ncbi:TIGR02186 family protein [Erythrobacter crassostreae]|uniref:TIGR02186 family protein n=1 Tax=Erythrobacter crassostreae TaxID=2828328 RepID=A0A9X1F5I5_9SPHN|nr:TIGR02186 family protein [Erythrobacter crassostrea]MBV7259205.1 TIGR02186 family protein [Erythrobacter crassostrea]
MHSPFERALKFGFLGLAVLSLSAQREPVLVPEVSQSRIEVRQGFTGANLLLYGAVIDPVGGRERTQYDIVVVLKGPAEPVRLREKDRIAGIWMNAGSSDFRSVPSFFAVASSRPVDEIVDERTAAIYELGTDFIQLSPSGEIEPEEQNRFAAGLVDMRQRAGLYKVDPDGVRISEGVLYQARIALPSNVITGPYTAETFAIAEGRVLASATAEIEVAKVGLEGQVVNAAERSSLLYGLVAIILSLGMGLIAGRYFNRS